jgi:hypothetical protein
LFLFRRKSKQLGTFRVVDEQIRRHRYGLVVFLQRGKLGNGQAR